MNNLVRVEPEMFSSIILPRLSRSYWRPIRTGLQRGRNCIAYILTPPRIVEHRDNSRRSPVSLSWTEKNVWLSQSYTCVMPLLPEWFARTYQRHLCDPCMRTAEAQFVFTAIFHWSTPPEVTLVRVTSLYHFFPTSTLCDSKTILSSYKSSDIGAHSDRKISDL